MRMSHKINQSELLLNNDSSIYHLNLHPTEIAETIILVGDPERVAMVSNNFDSVEIKKQKREFVTHTGSLNGKRISVVSTGIGISNIDIVLTELDALFNIDLNTRKIRPQITTLDIYRIGTCGGLSKDLPMYAPIISDYAMTFDVLMQYYQHNKQEDNLYGALLDHFSDFKLDNALELISGTKKLIDKFPKSFNRGITLTCSGFYAPQGRQLRLPVAYDILSRAASFGFEDERILNFEMETAGIYFLANLLGHNYCSISCMIANRVSEVFGADYEKAMESLIQQVLKNITPKATTG